MTIFYKFNSKKIFTKVVEINDDKSRPLYSTAIAPPTIPEGYDAKWTGKEWELVIKEEPVIPVPESPIPEEIPVAPTRPKLTITSLSSNDNQALIDLANREITLREGYSVSANITLTYNGNLLPITSAFRMPILSLDGRMKLFLINMINGVIDFTVTMKESGIWTVTKEQINYNLPSEQQMDLDELKIYVIQID